MNIRAVQDYLGRTMHQVDSYLRSLGGRELSPTRVGFAKLPTVAEEGKVGKILGMYPFGGRDVFVDRLYLDPEDPERHLVEAAPMDRVAGEEFLHKGQFETGAMKRYWEKFGRFAGRMLEGAASYVADKLFGRAGIYQREQRAFRVLAGDLGERDAFLGKGLDRVGGKKLAEIYRILDEGDFDAARAA